MLIVVLVSCGPIDLHFSAVGKTVAQVKVNEALIRHTCLIGHAFEYCTTSSDSRLVTGFFNLDA